jgi:hypothetical protein
VYFTRLHLKKHTTHLRKNEQASAYFNNDNYCSLFWQLNNMSLLTILLSHFMGQIGSLTLMKEQFWMFEAAVEENVWAYGGRSHERLFIHSFNQSSMALQPVIRP